MANILIVSGSYFPHATANAVCMKQYEKALIKEGHRVFYAVKRFDFSMDDVTVEDGIEVYHVGNSVEEFYKVCSRLQQIGLPKPLGFLFRSSLLMIKAFMKAYTKLFYGSQRRYSLEKYIDRYAAKINDIVIKENIDAIISVSMPFLSNSAVLKYKEKYQKDRNIKWIAYMIDAYSQKYGVTGKEQEDKVKEETEMLKKADSVLMLNVLRSDYEKEPFKKYFDKINFAYLPLFDLSDEESKPEKTGITVSEGCVDCVFAGTLYDYTSSLKNFCDFVKLLNDEKYIFHFMGKIYPENLEMLNNLEGQTKCRIKIYGKMPYDFAKASMAKADVLVNIGNMSTNQIPSKIFQYMAQLKPVLNFYKIKEDTALPYLKKYPLAYNVDESCKADDTTVKGFVKFYEGLGKVMLDKDKLSEIFKGYTSEDVCTDFIQYFNRVLDNQRNRQNE